MKLEDLDKVVLKKIEKRVEKYRLLCSKKKVLEKEFEVVAILKKEISSIEEEIHALDNKIGVLARTNKGEKQ